MPIRTSEAMWDGGLQDGKGRFWTESGEVSEVYSFATRFEDQEGANPEELIGAALATCCAMALSADVERAGHRPESVRTVASVHLDETEQGPVLSGIDLDAEARVPGIDADEFRAIAEATTVNRPIGKALSAFPIRLQARLSA
jgi:osmotically inducible protein OsmC